MANNKVQLADGTVLMDVTDTTALASTVKSGDIFYNAAGIRQTGTLIVDETYSIQQNLTNVTSSVDDTKVIAGNCFYTKLTPLEGYNILSVIVTMDGVDITRQVFNPGTIEKSIIANGTYNASSDMASGYSKVVVNVPSVSPTLGTKTIVSNGTYTASSDSLDGYSEVTVTVPNSYTASDEGKVVSNGALISQTSDTVTQNGTVDTTLISSLIVNVASGGGGLKYETGIFTLASDTTVDANHPYAVSHSLGIAPSVVIVFPKNTPTQSGDPARGYIWMDKPMGESKQYTSSTGTSSYPLCINYYVSDFGPPLKTRANIPSSNSYLILSATKPTATHFYLYRQASSTVFYAGDYRYFICDKWW